MLKSLYIQKEPPAGSEKQPTDAKPINVETVEEPVLEADVAVTRVVDGAVVVGARVEVLESG